MPRKEKTGGRCLALFPGAFRPPHKAHFGAVFNLAARPDVDEVVIIITNRCRHIPGTTKALDVDVAQRIWSIYLKNMPKVRVEVAQNSAVKHALSYIEKVREGTTLLFCAGENELDQGGGRFSQIECLAKCKGILASIVPSETPPVYGGATSLRTSLSLGNAGKDRFMENIPAHLTPEQQDKVWSICRRGMQEMNDITQKKVRAILDASHLGTVESIIQAKDGKTDPVFQVELHDGRRLFVKYAKDTVKAASLGHDNSLKPRQRLSVERRYLGFLRENIDSNVQIPEIAYFNKSLKITALTEVCPGGRSLLEDLKKGQFDPLIAARSSQFLAKCHGVDVCVPILWGSKEADRRHSKTMLSITIKKAASCHDSPQLHRDLMALQFASENAYGHSSVILDFSPKNIIVADHTIGVIDFELASSIGDPAFDFGCFLGHYLYWGLKIASINACKEAVHSALVSYKCQIGPLWQPLCPRVIAFAGTTILCMLASEKQGDVFDSKRVELIVASVLLEAGLSMDDIDPEEVFNRLVF